MNDFSLEVKEPSLKVGKPCSSCPENKNYSNLYLGPGQYWDSDLEKSKDYQYEGVPICTFCCGLALEYPGDQEFEHHTKRIRDLRCLYHPSDGFPPPYEVAKYAYLASLVKEVKEVVTEYGTGVGGSMAQDIQQGSFDRPLTNLKESAEKELAILSSYPETRNPSAEALRSALLTIYGGKSIEEAEQSFKQAEDEHPDFANIPFEHAMFLLRLKRNPSISIDLFIKAATLDNQQPEYPYWAAEMFYHLDDLTQSERWLEIARNSLLSNNADEIRIKLGDLEERIKYRQKETQKQVDTRLAEAKKWKASLYQLSAARVLFSSGRYNEALKFLAKAKVAEGKEKHQDEIEKIESLINKYRKT